MWWPLTLTYIFKVSQPWLRKSCLLCSVYSSGWILFFWHKWSLSIEGVLRVMFFSESANLNPYLAQLITNKIRCVEYNDLCPWSISSRSFGLGLENLVHSVASTVLAGFFPYLVQIITSIRRCVACDDLWPWPIYSRSFDLDFENRVRSVASTVLDGFFLYLAQMITIIRGCVACCVFVRIWKFEFLANFLYFSALTLKKNYSSRWILSIFGTNHHKHQRVCRM